MRKLAITLAAVAAALLCFAPAAGAFGIEDFDVVFDRADGSPATQAGSHPFALKTSVSLQTVFDPDLGEAGIDVPDGSVKNLITEFPPGLIADATAIPRCSTTEFILGEKSTASFCSDSTAVGVARLVLNTLTVRAPIYNLQPAPGTVAKLAFKALGAPVIVEVGIGDEPPYRGYGRLTGTSQIVRVYGGELEIWGVPADPAHDPDRGACLEGATDSCATEAPQAPFLTLPGSCLGPQASDLRADSWQNPGAFVFAQALTHDDAEPPTPIGMTGCGALGFSPRIEARSTADSAETGTGLDFEVRFADEGLKSAEGIAQSQIKEARVALPEGMTVNPSVAEGLGVCTPADLGRETLASGPGEGCPNRSKIGTVRVETPLVQEAVEGSVFLAQQDDPATTTPGAENPFDSLIALHLVLRNAELGVLVKLALKVEPDPRTGQLVTTVTDIPQLPFSSFSFHFREGQRAPLVTPPACGPHAVSARFVPWADPDRPLALGASFEIARGVGGGACPAGGAPPFHPSFEAGSINNNAGSFSPFAMRLQRADGEQNMTKLSSVLPPGVLGSLAGVTKCPDVAVPTAKSKTGRQELATPSCPANSLIGHTLAGAGVGSALTYVEGQIYLAGPYNGSPLSVIAVTPAVAGPFDAGTVVVRLALDLNPKTAEVEVNGANSDPIPHILQGIVLKLRDLRVHVDRPNFTLNPTSCEESSAKAQLFGSFLDVLSPADDLPVDLATRYQAANCLSLGFGPKLRLKLKGGTRRGGHPGLRAIYTPKRGDANIEGLVVRLPRSAFLDQAHIRTICTRVQWAADACPPGSRYGYIRAWTPLLDEPLQGPVYLRSSSHNLPDLLFDLKGLVDIEVATRIDSVRGGIRARVMNAPDAPISKVVLRMQGGRKGLIVNSRNLCFKPGRNRAATRFEGQNGKRVTRKPVMSARCGKKRTHNRRRRG